jgi:hypothetical protein
MVKRRNEGFVRSFVRLFDFHSFSWLHSNNNTRDNAWTCASKRSLTCKDPLSLNLFFLHHPPSLSLFTNPLSLFHSFFFSFFSLPSSFSFFSIPLFPILFFFLKVFHNHPPSLSLFLSWCPHLSFSVSRFYLLAPLPSCVFLSLSFPPSSLTITLYIYLSL